MSDETDKPEFWEAAFVKNQEMWGFKPSSSALLTLDFFNEKTIRNILIPGVGYGRNAKIFIDKGITVTGIEISATAIDMARKHYGPAMIIHHGSALDMPFDNSRYDGIFCHALLHLLDGNERDKLIRDCFNQLSPNGYMIFSVISKQAHTYGKGEFISKDRFEMFGGVRMFFYDEESIHAEFDKVGLSDITEVFDDYPMFLIKCKRAPQPSKTI